MKHGIILAPSFGIVLPITWKSTKVIASTFFASFCVLQSNGHGLQHGL